MPQKFNTIEIEGSIDQHHHLRLTDPLLPEAEPGPVRVLVLIPKSVEISEHDWQGGAATNPAFDFLKDSAEDIYTPLDGKPFHDQR